MKVVDYLQAIYSIKLAAHRLFTGFVFMRKKIENHQEMSPLELFLVGTGGRAIATTQPVFAHLQ